MLHQTGSEIQKAVLVGLQLPQMTMQEVENSLQELTRLVTTLGHRVVGEVKQKRSTERAANVLGDGKLAELARWTGGTGKVAGYVEVKKSKAARKWEAEAQAASEADAEPEDENSISAETAAPGETADLVIVDCDLSPSQLRNLESATGVTVLDRTGVIIEIFSRHARTKAARLQVEIARLTYLAPRIREVGGNDSQQGGGGKGSGETSLELDKRKIRDRLKELRTELAAIGNEHEVRRAKREQELCVALVGYTNAGKSSLMRALTGSEILVADKLFATLDTTIRPLHPESRPKVLVSDTVGFIKKLPHDLVASFKSTLDEALHASLLLFVVDCSDPSFRSQLQVTQSVLAEVGATEAPSLLVLNKKDRLTAEQAASLMSEFPEALMISTRNPEDLQLLRQRILQFFEKDMVDTDLFVPYLAQGVVGEVRSKTRVLTETYSDKGVTYKVRAPEEVVAALTEKIKRTEQK